ncbi:amino acid racemase [Formosa sediminum]|uniref:Amino acid racemase n=1 Tax=Formosa sediminum TaxID=2594004 RepID=A0A516GP95_9FLAO|nr:amino acid racemase [Formosa sediminum]QDO93323.1 amino acid racemase [Formosa sediminum]
MKKYIYGLLFLGLTAFMIPTKKNLMQLEIQQSKMNTLGLIGGTSWHSTLDYYSTINQFVNDYFGNNTNPPLLVYTLNQAEVHRFQREDKWDSIAGLLTHAALSLNKAGAQSVMFCANTPHKVYNKVQNQLDFPIIHIADATAKAIHKKGLKKVCFIGTKYSMTEDFITKRIEENGLDVLVPEDEKVIEELHRIIIEELTYGEVKAESKAYVLSVLKDMINSGAEGVILGCTEFPLMIFEDDLEVPIFDTTKIHSQSGVDYILKK